MTQDEMKRLLRQSTVRVIAEDGLDKTSTRAIAAASGLNKVYIYRLFHSKEELLREVFASLDEELLSKILFHLPVIYRQTTDSESRLLALLSAFWRYLLDNPEKCLCYVRYYYSPYFHRYSYEGHKRRCQAIVEKVSPEFGESANVPVLLSYVFGGMLDFAVKVLQGSLADSAETEKTVFSLLYASVRPHLKFPAGKGEEELPA